MNDLTTNIHARQDAEALLALAGEQPQRFWEVVAEFAATKLPSKPATVDRYPAMTEQEATKFESMTVPYGKHSGDKMGCVPTDYLLLLTEGDDFSRRLRRRYVKSKRFQDRQED